MQPHSPPRLGIARIGPSLVLSTQRLGAMSLDERTEHVQHLLTAPELPSARELIVATYALDDDPVLRRVLYRVLLRLPDPATTLDALRSRRPNERDPLAGLAADLVALRLGDEAPRERVRAALARPAIEDISLIVSEVHALGEAPHLAPLFASWLDDPRDVAAVSHRQPSLGMLRVHDHGVWILHLLGVVVAGAATHLEPSTPATLASARQAIQVLRAGGAE